jgi:hypothetical protein
MFRRITTFGVSLAVLTGACDAQRTVCPGDLRYAINISVHDSLTGAAAASGVTATATRRGDTPETVVEPNDPTNVRNPIALGNQPGTYDVVLTKTGYVTWSRTGIVVDADECNQPRLVTLQALLNRL